jgi:anti-sigma regulatory factor (Ser/Thr protein kinase)
VTERRSYPCAPASITRARHFVAGKLKAVPASALESVSLIVSELTTNAVIHAHTGFTVELDVNPAYVRVAVTDVGSGRPAIAPASPVAPSGRGLRIVDLLSEDWGVIASTSERGKTVWSKVAIVEEDRRLQGVQ